MLSAEFITDDWRARLDARTEEFRRRAAARAAVRRDMTLRRANGLVDRHAGRLAAARLAAARCGAARDRPSKPDSPGG